MSSPSTLHRQLFVRGNPVKLVDILGFASDEDLKQANKDYRNKKTRLEDLRVTVDKTYQEYGIPSWVKTQSDIDQLITNWQTMRAQCVIEKTKAEEDSRKWYNRLLGLKDDYEDIAQSYGEIISTANEQIEKLTRWKTNLPVEKIEETRQTAEEINTARKKRDTLVEEIKKDKSLFYGCTAYVASQFDVTWSGHAGTWAKNAKKQGYIVDSDPQVGDIMVTSSGGYGHVAVIRDVQWGTNDKGEKVLKSVTIEEGQYYKFRIGEDGYWQSTGTTAGAGQYYSGPVGGNKAELNKTDIRTLSGDDLTGLQYIRPLED